MGDVLTGASHVVAGPLYVYIVMWSSYLVVTVMVPTVWAVKVCVEAERMSEA